MLVWNCTRILEPILVGVILTENPDDTKTDDDVLAKGFAMVVALTTCITLPAGKLAVEALVSTVPASSGNVSVLSVFVAGLLIVNTPVPDAEGVSAILLMVLPQSKM
jgi:hypothetical protein